MNQCVHRLVKLSGHTEYVYRIEAPRFALEKLKQKWKDLLAAAPVCSQLWLNFI